MKIEIPENIRKYVEDERTVPLISYNRSLWYHITKEEKAALVALVAALDALPRKDWEALPDSEKWRLSCMVHDAERIVRQSIIKEAEI